MRKVLTILFFVVAVFVVRAQERSSRQWDIEPEESAKQRTEELNKRLELTAEQQKSVYDIHLEQALQLKASREKKDTDRRKLMAETRERMEKTQQRINEVLTEKQRIVFKELQEERRAAMTDARNNNRERPQRRGNRD